VNKNKKQIAMISFRKFRMKQFLRNIPKKGQLEVKTFFFDRLLGDLRVDLKMTYQEFNCLCEIFAEKIDFNLFEGVEVKDITDYLKLLESKLGKSYVSNLPRISFSIKRVQKERRFPFNFSELTQDLLNYRVIIFKNNEDIPSTLETLTFGYYEWRDPKSHDSYLEDEEFSEY
jgi:hypothetical protein